MSIHILTESFVESLIGSIPRNVGRYSADQPWLADVAGPGRWSIDTGLEPAEPLALLMPDGGDLKDLENAIVVHKALSFLTPVQARDPRLWMYLSHVDCWDYMRMRWFARRPQGDADQVRRFIVKRYLVAQNQSRALTDHGIARLWWYSRLTHDPTRADPYELTAVLLDQLDIAQQLLERSLGRVPQLLTGFLDFLMAHRTDLLGPGNGKRTRIRHLAKFLNQYGGVTLLDCLKQENLKYLLEAELARVNARPELVEA